MSHGRTRSLRALLGVVVVLLALLGLGACSDDDADAGAGAAIGVDAFAERVASTPDVVVLDVRTPEEYAAGHLPRAVNVDVSSDDFAERVDQLDRAVAYAVYCRSGNRSATAVDHMVEAGFDDVEHLDGGIAAWQAAGGPVER